MKTTKTKTGQSRNFWNLPKAQREKLIRNTMKHHKCARIVAVIHLRRVLWYVEDRYKSS